MTHSGHPLINFAMSTLDKIANFLHQGTSAYLPSMERFPKIDIDRLEDDLKVKQTARERGAQELPKSDADYPDAEEISIARYLEEEALKARDHVTRQLKALSARAAAHRLEGRKFRIETIASDAVANFRMKADQGVNQLTLDLQRVKDNHNHRTKFKARNRLERPVKETSNVFLKVGILLLLGLFETFLNGTFFSSGLDTGLLGGFSVALGIAVLNIGFGVVAGIFVFRQLHHIHPVRKACGIAGTVACFMLVVVFNLMVSQYRLALQGDLASQAATIAWEALWALNIRMDFDGVVVTILGIAFSALAALDGYTMWDPYPGYSRVENAYRKATEQYSFDQREIIDELGEIKDASIASLRGEQDGLPLATQQVESVVAEAKQLVDEYKTYLRSLSQMAAAMVRRYRDENSVARSTPSPAYFNQPIQQFDSGTSLESQMPSVDSSLQTVLLAELSEKLSDASRSIFSEFHSVQERFPLLQDIFSNREFAAQ
jgi:hypothetical protein